MRVVVPYAVHDPKSRLSSVLSREERQEFSRAMLADVLNGVEKAGGSPVVLATDTIDVDVPVQVDDRSLSEAVNSELVRNPLPIGIVMADLALGTSRVFGDLFATPGDIVIAPGRGGGTNALVVRTAGFRVNYHGASYLDHLRVAYELEASLNEVDSYRLSTDIDEPSDLVEVFLRGEGAAADWLQDTGFRLEITEGRVTVTK